MKRFLLLIFAITLLPFLNIAQVIPNGGFESWTQTGYDDLNAPWLTFNANTAIYAKPTVTKVTGQSGSAVHLQGFFDVPHNDTASARILTTVPYSQKPTGISGYYRSDIIGHDTAWIGVGFKQNGKLLMAAEFPITGSQNTFNSFNFNFPKPLASNPDTMIVGVLVAGPYNGFPHPGSWLELDGLSLTGTGITQQIPDGGFESWNIQPIDIPTGWAVFGDGNVTRSTDDYANDYSVKIEANGVGGGLAAGNMGKGVPTIIAVDTVTGYYKYSAAGLDSGFIQLQLQNGGGTFGFNYYYFTSTTTWKYFELPFVYAIRPDTLKIFLGASKKIQHNTGTSTLYIDNLQLKSQPQTFTGIFDASKPDFELKAFPDPAQNQLNIKFSNATPSEFSLKIYGLDGRLLMDRIFNSGSSMISVPIDQLSTGLYFYEVSAHGSVVRNKFVKGD